MARNQELTIPPAATNVLDQHGGKILKACWAAPLGGCSGGLSKEHVLSRSVAGKHVAWVTPAGTTRFGIGSATVSILCRKHNTELSPLDGEAAKLVRAIRRFRSAGLEKLRRSPGAATHERVRVDGRQFERWALKTFLNATAASVGLGRGQLLPPLGINSVEIAQYIFGGTRECAGVALYSWPAEHSPFPEPGPVRAARLRASPVSDDVEVYAPDGRLKGRYRLPMYLYLDICGVEFGLRANITGLSLTDWERIAEGIACAKPLARAMRRPAHLVLRPTAISDLAEPEYTSLVVEFEW